MSKITFLIFAGFILMTAGIAAAQIREADVLTLQQCIEIALKKQPSINAAKNSLKASESRIGQARAGYFPQLSLQSNYQRIGPSQSSFLQSDPYDQFTNTLNLSQNVFDFGKTSTQVEIQSLNKESSQADLQDVTAQVVLVTKLAYRAFAQAKMGLEVAEETMRQFQQHYEIAKAFFEAGKSSKIDVTSAEVNLSNAGVNLLRAKNAARLARVNLNNAMGMPDAPAYDIYDNLNFVPYQGSVEEDLQMAYRNRPDLVSLAKKKEGLEKTIALNKKSYFPTLAGNASYGYSGEDLSVRQEDKYWAAGLTLSFPLFTGLSTKYQVEEARSNWEIIKANEESLKQKVYLEVQSAHLSLKEAEERISAGRVVVKQAEETVELAKGRYATGVGSSIEITDAMISLNNAKLNYIAALSDYFNAQANLEKAIGVIK